jgi:hypothetical protein
VTLGRVSIFADCSLDYLLAKRSLAGPFVSAFAECTRRHSAKVASLSSDEATTLDKEALLVPRCAFYVDYYDLDTR